MTLHAGSRFIRPALLGLAVLMVLSLAAVNAAAQTGTVTGTVTDAVTGLPIAGAHVVLRPASCGGGQYGLGCPYGNPGGAYHWGMGSGGHHGGMGGGHHGSSQAIRVETGADGTYVINDVPAGDYLTRAAACGYTPSELVPVTITDGGTLVQDFVLNPW